MGCESGQEGKRPWQTEFHRSASPGFSRVGHGGGQCEGLTSQTSEIPIGSGASMGFTPLSPPLLPDGMSRAPLALTRASRSLSVVFFRAPSAFLGRGPSHMSR